MNVNRSVLENYISERFFNILINKKEELELYDYAYEKYNYPKGIFSDFLSGRKNIATANDYTLFVITDSILNFTKKGRTISDFFTDREIELYGTTKYKDPDKIEFPLIFKMIQVADDQWIGTLDVNTFFSLQNAGIINYNPNTQRSMTRFTRNGNDIYRITLNKSAVNSIKTDMLERIYIPDTITLNIPADDEFADFYYDKENCQLVVNSIKAFDINDGYHRYVSMFQAKTQNTDFNYPMELRITNFDVQKSQQMIYQMDQKTKMIKQASDSYNSYAPQNKVVQRINESSVCNIQGYIGRTESKIDFVALAECIRIAYFNGKQDRKGSPEQRREIIRVAKEFIDDFNILTDEDDSYLDKIYSQAEIMTLTIIFNYYDGKDKRTMMETINKVMDTNLVPKRISHRIASTYSATKKKIVRFIEENIDVK